MDIKNEFNKLLTSLEPGSKWSLGWYLEKHAGKKPDKVAILYEERTITYSELNAGANRYANCFARLGFKRGDVIVLLMANRPEYLMAATGLSKLGVIISLVDIGIREDVMAHDINLCEARAVILGQELLGIFAEIEPRIRLRSPALILVDGDDDSNLTGRMQALQPLLKAVSDSNPDTTSTISSEDIMAYLYTPGHSGPRKAVPISQQNCLFRAHLFGMFGYMNENTVQYTCLPLHYNGGFIGAYTAMIVSGSAMVLRQRFSLSRFWDDVRKCGANYLLAVGEIGRYLYSQPEQGNDADNPLEVMVSAGMWGPLVEPFRQRFGLKHIIEIYTHTEGVGAFFNYEEITGMCGNLSLLGMHQGEVVQYNFSGRQIKRDAAGRAIKCSVGDLGLLICEINQFNKFSGYINDPEASEQAILSNVFREGDQYFDTGDLVRLHENNYISFIDRLGDTYRWKGRTVSASQVADVLKKFYGGIEDAVVYGVKVPAMEGRCGMAILQLLEDEQLNWPAFTKHINRRMPEHARPLFIRIADRLEGDQYSEEYKEKLRQEGFNPNKIKDPIVFLEPQSDQYIPLTFDLYKQIMAEEIQL